MSEIIASSVDNFVVSGELSFSTAVDLNRQGSALIQYCTKAKFDFSKVTFCDNAAVALLISWARCAKKFTKPIVFVKLPKQLLDIVSISGLKNLLPIE